MEEQTEFKIEKIEKYELDINEIELAQKTNVAMLVISILLYFYCTIRNIPDMVLVDNYNFEIYLKACINNFLGGIFFGVAVATENNILDTRQILKKAKNNSLNQKYELDVEEFMNINKFNNIGKKINIGLFIAICIYKMYTEGLSDWFNYIFYGGTLGSITKTMFDQKKVDNFIKKIEEEAALETEKDYTRKLK